MIYAGIDAGSRTIKAVLIREEAGGASPDENGAIEVIGSGVIDQGVEQDALARQLLAEVIAESGVSRSDVAAVVATGYGRKLIREADRAITEITCQAAGVALRGEGVRTVVDIGGQDSKMLRLSADGAVTDFVMNDRCAAGTGRFLEVVATRLELPLAEFGAMAAVGRRSVRISNMCVVFAETEIVGLMADGAAPRDIALGVQEAIAARVIAMGGGRIVGPVAFTGGVALIPGMKEALERTLGEPVVIPAEPQTTCALGAAILASKRREVDRRAGR